ncbi:MAG TPA: amidase [Acidimicrobiales bacterium]|nr:amidase [Acidimicrobiales bacterium]
MPSENGISQDDAFTPALEWASRIRDREVSPTEVVDFYLERADRLNPKLNAYITIAHEQAREAAEQAEKVLAEGRVSSELPPFLGVPISIKDLTDTAGIRTTKGTAAFGERVPDADDPVVAKLKRAGFVVMGKSNTPEFGIGSTDPLAYGPARNPWDPELTTRGSSGGSAATLAAAMCPISHASDGGGSIRLPAATCGTVGLKPSRGRVSAAPGAQSMQVQKGPCARTVADAAAFLDCLAGYEPGDGFWAPAPERAFVDEVGRDPGRLRIAFMTDLDPTPTHPEYREAVRATAKVLEGAGHEVFEGGPTWPDLELTAKFIWAFSGQLTALEDKMPPLETLDPTIRDLMEAARQIPLKGYLQAESDIAAHARKMVESFEEFDVLLTPTVIGPPRRIDQLRDADGKPIGDSNVGQFCWIWNSTGQPAITLPLHVDSNNLPIGIQFVGRPADEATLLRLSGQLEVLLPWGDRRPPAS